jgi:hypothetical protein
MKYIQTLAPVRKFLESYLKRSPNASLPTLFKQARKLKTVSYIGDWPMINEIVYWCADKKNKYFSTKEVVKVHRMSDDPFLQKSRSNSKLVALLTNKEELRAKISAQK